MSLFQNQHEKRQLLVAQLITNATQMLKCFGAGLEAGCAQIPPKQKKSARITAVVIAAGINSPLLVQNSKIQGCGGCYITADLSFAERHV